MSRQTTVADLRRMLDDVPDYYPVLVEIEDGEDEWIEPVREVAAAGGPVPYVAIRLGAS